MKIHFIGIGGIGMSALAQYFLAQGDLVSGSDVVENENIEYLRKLGAKIPECIKRIPQPSPLKRGREREGDFGHRPENVPPDADLVIYNAAIQKNNPEILRAKELKIPTKSYAETLGDLTREKFTIAISGMHGKSTTTAMLAKIMEKAGLDPTVIVGAKAKWEKIPPNPPFVKGGSEEKRGKENISNFRLGKSQYLLIEADEFNASFLNYWPKIIVLLNIEEEHLDYYRDLNHILKTFAEYVGHLDKNGILVANEENENINKIITNNQDTITKQIPNSNFQIIKYSPELKTENLHLKIPGQHNISNAHAAMAAARALGIKDEISIKTLNEFSGIWRRMEFRGQVNGAKIYDDYGHHPTEIKATLEGARELLAKKIPPNPPLLKGEEGRLWCVFQPHQYQRLDKLFDRFISAFGAADKLVLLPVFNVPGRELEEIKAKTGSEKLAEAICARRLAPGANREFPEETIYLKNFDEAEKYLRENLKSGDICVIMGAGDAYELTKKLIG